MFRSSSCSMSVLHWQLFRSFGKPVIKSVISENTCRHFLLSRGFATNIEFRFVGYNYVGLWMSQVCYKH